jgi:hypothetical protein
VSYVLIRMEVNGDGRRDRPSHIAISNNEDNLVSYCQNTFGKSIGKPSALNFTWEDYFIIEETSIVII